MSTVPMFGEPEWNEDAVASIYGLYPRKVDRKRGIVRICQALTRIANGEIDGKPRSAEESIAYLRERTEVARAKYAGRSKEYIPHVATFYHQRRYLSLKAVVTLDGISNDRIMMAVNILSQFPGIGPIPMDDLQPLAPLLLIVDNELEQLRHNRQLAGGAYEYLLGKTRDYAAAVATWRSEDQQYVSSPEKWYALKRYRQPKARWRRDNSSGWQAEREQVARVIRG
jgi:hypothetical protein